MRIAIGADHNGLDLKALLIKRLTADGHELEDCGAYIRAETVDYPPLCQDVGLRVVDGRADRGIIVGGSGQGEHIACNKIKGVRAGLCHDRFTTEISRAHNDSNMLIIGAKVIGPGLAEELTQLWMTTPFKGGVHQDRLDQIAAIERGERLV
jgi:ribose 5-phosphate isomerase B